MINRDGFNGFTLAEVLIALVVIGIIAAITLTTVMPNIQERVNSQRQANIVYKITQATNLMKANGAMINGFESTDAFVDELQKYLKITKRCDSEHIAECWPTKKIISGEGKEYNIADAKLRKNLGFSNNLENKNVAIVLADGASIILTYNGESEGLSIGSPLTWYANSLPVGGGYKEFLEYSSSSTANLAFIMDVNGSKGPNVESDLTKNSYKDIRSFNNAKIQGCNGFKQNGTCFSIFLAGSYQPKDCAAANGAGTCDGSTETTPDYWSGARDKCAEIGGTLQTSAPYGEVCTKLYEALGKPDHEVDFFGSRYNYSNTSSFYDMNNSWAYGWKVGPNGCKVAGESYGRRSNLNVLCK